MKCRCHETERVDGPEADSYASEHLALVERGREPLEMYVCHETGFGWVMDFPLGHWSEDRRGRVRLRREPIDHATLPIGALDL